MVEKIFYFNRNQMVKKLTLLSESFNEWPESDLLALINRRLLFYYTENKSGLNFNSGSDLIFLAPSPTWLQT